ncbi:unnamed protein product, partial [Prorocentrum cordatum]
MDGAPQRDWEFLTDADPNTKEAYPVFGLGNLTAKRVETTAEARHSHNPSESNDKKILVEINIATFNIQSGREPKEGSKRRKEKINKLKTTMACLYDEDLHIIGIQEARTPWGVRDAGQDDDARCANANCYRTTSSGHKGFNYGCELHVLLSKPYGKNGKQELFFKPDKFTVVVKDPRLLIVRVAALGFNHVLAVAHAPHSKALATEKDSYWKKLAENTEKHQVNIIFPDASARTGSTTSAAIGDKGFKQNEDPNGHRLHELLLTNHLAAANTFVSHGPEHHTWHSGKDPHRIDYAIIPKGYIDSIEECAVLYGIDSGQDPETKDDHYPVKMQLAYQIVSSVTKGNPKLDESKLADEGCRKNFCQKLDEVKHTPWDTNVNEHLAIVTEKVTEAAYKRFRSNSRTPHKPYLTGLRYTAKIIAREALLPDPSDASALAALSDYVKLVAASIIFSTPSLASHVVEPDDANTTHSAQHYFDAHLLFLRTSKSTLQKWITTDRDDFLERTAGEMGAAIDDHAPRLEALYAKRLLAFGGRKSKKPPMPIIRTNDDGEPLTEKSEIADHALAFHGKVEQAIATNADGVAADYNKRTRHAGPEPNIQHIIPKHQLTSQPAAAKRGRRGGPDQLTDDMSRASPEGMARLLHPVLVKTHFESTEPIAAKGGYTTYFHKGQAAMELQKSYRGTLPNNTIGKMHSAFLRSRVKGLLPELLEATQCGARPKMATDVITHTSLAFISDCQRRSRSCSITFLDLREAFHSVIREFCMQLPTTADELNELIERIDIPDFIRPALKEGLQQPAYNNQHTDDEHLCHMIADHHTPNWMTAKSARHYQLPRTSTRPGVPYSDVAFNIHFAIMLRASDQAVREEEAHGQQRGSALRNMSFVDGPTDYNSTANANDLINTKALAAARLCTAAFQHGLKPHPENTKAIFMHYGAGAKQEKQRTAKEGIAYLELDGLAIKVQLVAQQKALGTIVSAGGVTGPEICPRANRALGAARPLEKQILRRKKLSKKAKVKHVHSLSTSSPTYNHHAWNDLAQKDLKHISAKYMGPYRVAASLPKTNSPVQHISEAEAIAKT